MRLLDNEYCVEYKKISDNGVLDISYTRVQVKGTNKDNALVALRNQLAQEGVYDIRIGKIIDNNTPQDIESPKKKKSFLGWIAGGIFILAMSAKLIKNLI